MVYLGILNYRIASAALSPIDYIGKIFDRNSLMIYLNIIEGEIELSNREFEETRRGHIKNLPVNLFSRPPITGGADNFFGKFIQIIELTIKNKDQSTYNFALDTYLQNFQFLLGSNSKASGEVKSVAQNQFSLLVRVIIEASGEHYFLEIFAEKLYKILLGEGAQRGPFDSKINSIASALEVISVASFESKAKIDIKKLLHTMHLFILKVFNELLGKENESLNLYNFSIFIDVVKRIGLKAIKHDQFFVLYTAMESICYLGCHFAKNKNEQSVLTCLNALVQMGRTSKSSGMQCFWDRCLHPPHIHAEEFLGHIMTWAVAHKDGDRFFLQGGFEGAYSRIRGYEVDIIPKAALNPVFWVEDVKDAEGNKTPWVESVHGMYGYYSELDYSDFDNLKQYVLHNYGGGSTFESSPVSFDIEGDEEGEEP